MGSHSSEESHGKGIRAAQVKRQLGESCEINVGKPSGNKGLLTTQGTLHTAPNCLQPIPSSRGSLLWSSHDR